MIEQLKITIIIDNSCSDELLAEHGLCILIETNDTTVLFDTGNGSVIEHNFAKRGIDPQKIDCLVLSHGHWDHTGGVVYLSQVVKPDIKIFLHSAALKPKYSLHDHKFSYSGIPPKSLSWLKAKERILILCDKPVDITENFSITGKIPKKNKIETIPTHFFHSKNTTEPDQLSDDISLFLETPKGIIVIIGCCHSGIGNTLDYIASLTETRKIHAVIGGMHLKGCNTSRLDFTSNILDKYQVELFAPCHCTGQKETAYLYRNSPLAYQPCHAGSCFEF